jgi:hypothetical protein
MMNLSSLSKTGLLGIFNHRVLPFLQLLLLPSYAAPHTVGLGVIGLLGLQAYYVYTR